MTEVRPIQDADLADACTFLNRNLNPDFSVHEWMEGFKRPWCPEKPNNGFMLVDGGRIVGMYGAIYSDRMVRGVSERFCNLTSWVVEPPYRGASLSIVRALLSQRALHFTNFTPTPQLVPVFRKLGFSLLDARRWVIPCLPGPVGGSVLTDRDEIERHLPPEAARIFRDHEGLPWLGRIAVGLGDAWCLVAYKKRRWRRHAHAFILHVSAPEVFMRQHGLVGRYLLAAERTLSMSVAARNLPGRPLPSLAVEDPQVRVYRTETLSPHDITLLYSELVALNLP